MADFADYSEYKFEIGKAFRQKEPESPEEYLETAEKIHGFLERHKVETPDGVYWKETPDQKEIDFSYTHGSAGIAYFYLELYKVTGKEIYKELVLQDICKRSFAYSQPEALTVCKRRFVMHLILRQTVL